MIGWRERRRVDGRSVLPTPPKAACVRCDRQTACCSLLCLLCVCGWCAGQMDRSHFLSSQGAISQRVGIVGAANHASTVCSLRSQAGSITISTVALFIIPPPLLWLTHAPLPLMSKRCVCIGRHFLVFCLVVVPYHILCICLFLFFLSLFLLFLSL